MRMIRAVGYAGICLGLPERSVSRTMRLANATPGRVREVAAANLRDLLAILRYNVTHDYRLFRINQSIIPFISHPASRLRWWEDAELLPLLRACGQFVGDHGLRVSMHPGQYTVLNSLNPAVVEAALAELRATARVFEVMGLGPSHKIVIHGGAGMPTRAEALGRFATAWWRLPPAVRARVVLENDDRVFGVSDLLPVCHALGIPLVFDWLHHHAQPGAWAGRAVRDIMAEVVATWRADDGWPKVHFSSQDAGKRPGAHAYWLDKDDFVRCLTELAPYTVDMMMECKGKDLALARLRDEMGWVFWGESRAPAA